MGDLNGFRRKIFYLGGYDPRGARFYHQLYAEQAALYAERSGHEVVVSDRRRAGPLNSRWTVEDKTAGSSADMTFLGWDDIIRRTWDHNPLRLLWGAIASTLSFTARMDWSITRTFPPGSLIAFYYPATSVVVIPLLLIGLIWLLVGIIPALVIGLALSFFVIHRLKSFWLLRFVIFNDRYARRTTDPALDDRLEEMAQTIQAELSQDWDEVLFVTHSNGGILAMPIMASLLEKNGGVMPASFGLLTLGSSVPLLGCRRDAARYETVLSTVSRGDFLWLDLGSLTDGACIALLDPCVSVKEAHRPTIHSLSPRWFKYADTEAHRLRRRNKYETHFDYLRSFPRISPLDYFRLTSGGMPLAASIAAFEREPA
ncbi:hypothetical protein [Sphingobium xanthum]|uniref:hypothetical protein n=1 Tax=Sphingobium xanthum TaxID=1387165 RepID=UPI001FE2576B|nr:hypothetical protein [Sphingobium xanthum]